MTALENQLTEALQTIGCLPLEFNGRARAIAQKFVTAPAGGWKDHLSPEQINNLLAWSAPVKETTAMNTETESTIVETKQPETGTEAPKAELKPCVNYPCRSFSGNRPSGCTKPNPKGCDDYMTAKPAYLPPAIEMIPVASSNLKGFGHDGNKTLRVWFLNDTAYDYPGATEDQFFAMVNAESAGKAYNAFRKESGITGIKL